VPGFQQANVGANHVAGLVEMVQRPVRPVACQPVARLFGPELVANSPHRPTPVVSRLPPAADGLQSGAGRLQSARRLQSAAPRR